MITNRKNNNLLLLWSDYIYIMYNSTQLKVVIRKRYKSHTNGVSRSGLICSRHLPPPAFSSLPPSVLPELPSESRWEFGRLPEDGCGLKTQEVS